MESHCDEVLGHYSVLENGTLQPLLEESSVMFRALIQDDAHTVAQLLADGGAGRVYNVLHWAAHPKEDQPGQSGGGVAQHGAPLRRAPPQVAVKQRTPLLIAAHRAALTGGMSVLKLLLATPGADVRSSVGTGQDAFQAAAQAGGPHEAEVLALLRAAADRLPLQSVPVPAQQQQGAAGSVPLAHQLAGQAASCVSQSAGGPPPMQAAGVGRPNAQLEGMFPPNLGMPPPDRDGSGMSDTMGPSSDASDQGSGPTGIAPTCGRGPPTNGPAPGYQLAVDLHHHLSLPGAGEGEVGSMDPYHHQDSLPYSTSELTQAEYCTDDFRMFAFKVLRCSKRFAHDWRACPFAHPTENARRRDPRSFRYCALACPDYKQGFCVRGDLCHYAHGVFEAWLHPSRYRTQLCKDGANCHRPICFFAHSLPELRTPTHTWAPNSGDDTLSPMSTMAGGGAAMDPRASGSMMGAGMRLAGSAAQAVADTMSANSAPRNSNGKGDASMAAAFAAGAVPPPAPGPAAAAVLGFTAPRMSNAFARRHGLNPKDNAMLNLQKIALQMQPGGSLTGPVYGGGDALSRGHPAPWLNNNGSSAGGGVNGGPGAGGHPGSSMMPGPEYGSGSTMRGAANGNGGSAASGHVQHNSRGSSKAFSGAASTAAAGGLYAMGSSGPPGGSNPVPPIAVTPTPVMMLGGYGYGPPGAYGGGGMGLGGMGGVGAGTATPHRLSARHSNDHHHPASVAALNHQLASLGLQGHPGAGMVAYGGGGHPGHTGSLQHMAGLGMGGSGLDDGGVGGAFMPAMVGLTR